MVVWVWVMPSVVPLLLLLTLKNETLIVRTDEALIDLYLLLLLLLLLLWRDNSTLIVARRFHAAVATLDKSRCRPDATAATTQT